jgi:alpha-N-arabinofuranosidase
VPTCPVVRPVAFLIAAAASVLTAGAQTSVTVDATKAVRVVDNRMFGLNTAVWDGAFTDSQTLTSLGTVGAKFLRYPGGSSSDDYNWQNNSAVLEGGSAGTTTFDDFAAYANAIGAQVVITVNYGTGTPARLRPG